MACLTPGVRSASASAAPAWGQDEAAAGSEVVAGRSDPDAAQGVAVAFAALPPRCAPRPAHAAAEPEAETLHDIAPPHALAASILEERGLSAADLHGAFREATARQAVLLETQLGRDATILQMRAALDGHMAQAVLACRQYQDAVDAMIRLEVRVEAMRRTAPWRFDPPQGRGRAGTGHVPRPGARGTRRGRRRPRLRRRARALYPEPERIRSIGIQDLGACHSLGRLV